MLKTVQGYPVQNGIANMVVVSVEEGKRLRAADLKADKSRGSYFKPYVNPETWTDEERAYMEDKNASI